MTTHHGAADSPRVVLDTNASLALFAYADPSCSALRAALLQRRLCAVVNAVTRAEWQQVLQRPALRLDARCRAMAVREYDELLVSFENDIAIIDQPASLPRCRDPDDQVFLELARDSRAIALYTRDRELLRLSRRTLRQAGFVVMKPQDYRD